MERNRVDQIEPDRTSAAVLSTVATALARTNDLETALDAILDAAATALGVEVAVVFLQDPDRAELQLAAARGLAEDALGPFAAAVTSGQHPIAHVARTREAVWDRPSTIESASLVTADLPLAVTRGGVDVPLGVVSFGWTAGHDVTHVERGLVSAIADLIAVAVDHRRLASLVAERTEWFERMAHSDPLTGLANARTLARVLELEVARASRQASELSVVVFDVDRFATINDTAGHAAGDDVLRAVASVLAESVRLVDTVARGGADEFVLVAPGSAGTSVARRVLEGVRALPAVDGVDVTVSAGVARFPGDGASGDELLAAATAALSRAKAGGSDRLEPSASEVAG